MLVVHAVFSPSSGFGLWAEDSELGVRSPSKAKRVARAHPFAAGAEALTSRYAGSAEAATVLLPSLRGAPLDSPELLRRSPRPAPKSTPELLPWSVPLVRLTPTALLDILNQPAGDVRHGAAVEYVATLAEFAWDLVERGHLLPELVTDATGPIARWRPVLRGADRSRFASLATAMPPICRAEAAVLENSAEDPNDSALSALTAFVDAAQRSRLDGMRLLPRGKSRASEIRAAQSWLTALASADGRFEAEHSELDVLAVKLRPWESFGADEPTGAHLTFRLTDSLSEDTSDAEPAWRLEFLLQSTEDPSLLVTAEQAWAGDTGLVRWLRDPQELLLHELGRASRSYPELASSLDQARPCVLELDVDGAYRFLSNVAQVLDDAGFGVLLPSWWDHKRTVGLAVSASSSSSADVVASGGLGAQQLVDFDWQLAIGDEVLTDEEIQALANAKAPLVRLRGQWVAVDQQRLREGLEFLSGDSSGQATPGEFLRLASTHPDDVDAPLPLSTVRADGWLGDLLDGADERSIAAVHEPDDVRAELRPYQRRGLSWLSFLSSLGMGACLADDMGLGKTLQLLSLETHERASREVGASLLVCPMSVIGNWQREAEKFTPGLRIYPHHGAQRLRGDELAARLAETDIVVSTYATATRDIEELAAHDWHRVVLDEAQAVKNSRARSSAAVRRLPSNHRVALTGTPMENRLSEMWSIMDFLNPGLLGTAEKFRHRYAIPVERHGQREPAERLRRITRPFVLRRLKTDPAIIDDLPEKIEIKQYCGLSAEQASLYKAVADDMLDKIENSEGIERRGNVLATMAKLKQVCNHPAQLLHDQSAVPGRSGKLTRLEEVLDEILAEGDKVLCFTQFTEFAEMLLGHLATRFGQDVLYLHGGTSKKRRDEMVERFQSDGGPAIFLLSLKAGGTGLNLTAANHVLHLDRWWNPAVENQATDRAFRIGQKRNVQVRKFVCTGTLEEKIDTMIENKQALADMVISDGESWLTELSTNDLRDLLALEEGAVDE